MRFRGGGFRGSDIICAKVGRNGDFREVAVGSNLVFAKSRPAISRNFKIPKIRSSKYDDLFKNRTRRDLYGPNWREVVRRDDLPGTAGGTFGRKNGKTIIGLSDKKRPMLKIPCAMPLEYHTIAKYNRMGNRYTYIQYFPVAHHRSRS